MNPEFVQVTSIRFKVGEREIEFTPDEARALQRALRDVIGDIPTGTEWSKDGQIWIDPNVEPWPYPSWSLNWGPLRQSVTLCINTN